MDVRDKGEQSPSRLELGLAIARDLVERSGGVRFAVAVGKGTGVLAIPLTDDTEAVTLLLEGLSTSLVTGWGTNLESLINAAAGAFQDAFPTRRRIILFSDGEAFQGSFSQGIERVQAADIVLCAVGLGSEDGGAVPEFAVASNSSQTLPLGQGEGIGERVMSFLRRDTLRDAAERTGGIYLDGSRENAAALLADQLALVSPVSSRTLLSEGEEPRRSEGSSLPNISAGGFRRERKHRGYLFIIAALMALGLSKGCEKKRRQYAAL
jgi:Ca-activated chloride channel family protein